VLIICYKINSKHKIKEEEKEEGDDDDESFSIILFTSVPLHYNMSPIYMTQDE